MKGSRAGQGWVWGTPWLRCAGAALLVAGALLAGPAAAQIGTDWPRIDPRWRISCGADPGAIMGAGTDWLFRPSSNHCRGGSFLQRSELRADDIPADRALRYALQAEVALTSASDQPFDLFQLHDGLGGCAPPLKLRWLADGSLAFDSARRRHDGGCVPDTALRESPSTCTGLRRDGTVHRIGLWFDFDGRGGFEVRVALDGRDCLSGAFTQGDPADFDQSPRFFLKHGVYARHAFDFTLRTEGLILRQAP